MKSATINAKTVLPVEVQVHFDQKTSIKILLFFHTDGCTLGKADKLSHTDSVSGDKQRCNGQQN